MERGDEVTMEVLLYSESVFIVKWKFPITQLLVNLSIANNPSHKVVQFSLQL